MGTAAAAAKDGSGWKWEDGLNEDSFQREDKIVRLTDKDIRYGILYLRLPDRSLYMP